MKKQTQSPLLTSPIGGGIHYLILFLIYFSCSAEAAVVLPNGEDKGGATEAQQIKTLQKQLSALKKTSKQEKEQMQQQIDFRDAWAGDIDKSLETHNIRLMTNKMLIQGTIEGTLMKIKEEQMETSAGYARTKKIVWAALAAGAVAFVSLLTLLILMHRKNKKNFSLLEKTLGKYYTAAEILKREHEKDTADLKTEHNQLRIEFRISDEMLHKATQETRLRLTNIETTAKALHKEADERATSLAHFQQTMEDNMGKIKQYMLDEQTNLQKEMHKLEERLNAVEIYNDKLKIKNQ